MGRRGNDAGSQRADRLSRYPRSIGSHSLIIGLSLSTGLQIKATSSSNVRCCVVYSSLKPLKPDAKVLRGNVSEPSWKAPGGLGVVRVLKTKRLRVMNREYGPHLSRGLRVPDQRARVLGHLCWQRVSVGWSSGAITELALR